MTDTAWIDAALTSARPQAVGALLRYRISAESAAPYEDSNTVSRSKALTTQA